MPEVWNERLLARELSEDSKTQALAAEFSGVTVTAADSRYPRKDLRRSQRVKVRTPIAVRIQTAQKHLVAEDTEALVISAHGCLVLLATEVSASQFVTLVNPATGEEVLSRVTNIGPRIMGKAQVGIEFIKPSPRFWGFAPSPKA